MKVLWTPGARRRLQEIEAHIARDSPQAARRVVQNLLRRSLALGEPPLLGRRLEGFADDVRELLERPYRLIYRVGPRPSRS
jgi:toxin ParE1/3/4